jgi:hypothetical protein
MLASFSQTQADLMHMRARRMATRKRAEAACNHCKERKTRCSDYRPCARCGSSMTCTNIAPNPSSSNSPKRQKISHDKINWQPISIQLSGISTSILPPALSEVRAAAIAPAHPSPADVENGARCARALDAEPWRAARLKGRSDPTPLTSKSASHESLCKGFEGPSDELARLSHPTSSPSILAAAYSYASSYASFSGGMVGRGGGGQEGCRDSWTNVINLNITTSDPNAASHTARRLHQSADVAIGEADSDSDPPESTPTLPSDVSQSPRWFRRREWQWVWEAAAGPGDEDPFRGDFRLGWGGA